MEYFLCRSEQAIGDVFGLDYVLTGGDDGFDAVYARSIHNWNCRKLGFLLLQLGRP